MKQHIPFVLMLIFSLNLIFCLTVRAQEFSLDVKAGLIVSLSVIADKFDREAFSQRLKLGYGGGGLISFPLKDNYYFVVEGRLSQRGRKILSNDDTWTNISTYYFADASMLLRKAFPLQLKQNIPSKWSVNVGPHISYWMGVKDELAQLNCRNIPLCLSQCHFNQRALVLISIRCTIQILIAGYLVLILG